MVKIKKIEKYFCLAFCAVALLMMLVGAIIAIGAHSYHGTTSVRDVAFGGDYYTEQYNATKAVVSNTASTVYAATNTEENISKYFGLSLIFSGLLILLYNVKKYLCLVLETAGKADLLSEPVLEDPEIAGFLNDGEALMSEGFAEADNESEEFAQADNESEKFAKAEDESEESATGSHYE